MLKNAREHPIAIQGLQKKEKKNYAHTLYRHECEPVVQMLNIADRVVAWGVIPLLRGGLLLVKKGRLKAKRGKRFSFYFRGVQRCFVCYQVFFCLILGM